MTLLIPILNNNETNEKECFPPINGGLSEFIVYSIYLPNNEVWYKLLENAVSEFIRDITESSIKTICSVNYLSSYL